jgi:DNA-binding response OmpR family regulator
MSASLAGCLVLVVEDEPLIALDIANSFQQVGAKVITARTLEAAMTHAETADLTAAVIDHALHDGITTSDVCAKLTERKIPFIVYSGFNHLEGACADGELVHKPASPAMLVATLNGVLAQHRRNIN